MILQNDKVNLYYQKKINKLNGRKSSKVVDQVKSIYFWKRIILLRLNYKNST